MIEKQLLPAHQPSSELISREWSSWSYRGEGKTGLVVTNNNGLALKLRKGPAEDEYLKLYVRNLRYVHFCIAPIFGPFLCYGQVVKLPVGFASTIVTPLQSRRPTMRDSNIDSKCPYALLMPDACSLSGHDDVLTIEIKPKAALRTANNLETPLPCCRFCSNIERRFSSGSIASTTQYCPRDFFSSRWNQVARAVNALFDNPLSYMTVHRKNERIFDEENKDLESILGFGGYTSRQQLTAVIVKILISKRTSRNRNILQVIEEAQLINCLSIQDLCLIYTKFSDEGLDLDREIANWLAGESTLNDEFLDMLDLVIKFSISIIAQDISIMISISPKADNKLSQVMVNGVVYSYKLNIVDLDFKSVNKLPTYLAQERELLAN